ncbi:tyrosine kinase family protein [Medicago truncatula]|uniref:Tyrosine kinase family protein n=1 Tax=Medicago truncatula TaxID=3880 RepID=G7KX88_MEDTR|nr:tyrosine kinase family protein [Medicago truncatula]
MLCPGRICAYEKLGKGGFRVVYNISLRDSHQVEVKIINDSKGDGKDFINEVDRITRTSHVNIVSLLGFCYENKIKKGILALRWICDTYCDYLYMYELQLNLLTGLIPPSLFTLPNLKSNLGINKFFGSDVGPCDPQVKISLEILESFGHAYFVSNGKGKDDCIDEGVVKLNLTLAENRLIGSIPHILTTLPQLQLLDVSNNNLSGPIKYVSLGGRIILLNSVMIAISIFFLSFMKIPAKVVTGENGNSYPKIISLGRGWRELKNLLGQT